jgi:hypothetical protein
MFKQFRLDLAGGGGANEVISWVHIGIGLLFYVMIQMSMICIINLQLNNAPSQLFIPPVCVITLVGHVYDYRHLKKSEFTVCSDDY